MLLEETILKLILRIIQVIIPALLSGLSAWHLANVFGQVMCGGEGQGTVYIHIAAYVFLPHDFLPYREQNRDIFTY